MSNEMTVRVHADYQCFPTWVHRGHASENVAPDTLPISVGLAREFDQWGADFDATLDQDNPVDSGFRTPQEAEDFGERGERLARRLQLELGDSTRVVYYDIRKSARVAMS
ncbi:hypothetical protein ACIBBB_00410 [Streptomyces sp. NPDC051217]|uniref:hypothetical protein n=1 Tax=Streptomyces sp. NPDC051217 TaxID=3365644 RepID=UPI0037B6C27F